MGREHNDRLRRASEATAAMDLDALLIAPSADLVYLAGYDPLPLPRLTCLVVRPEREPVLVVPALERPLAEARAGTHVPEVLAWDETDDPYDLVARVLDGSARIACSDRMWASHLLGIQRAVPGTKVGSARRVLGPLRAVKDEHELHLLRRASRATDEAFRRIIQERLEGLTEREVASRLGELLLEMGLDAVEFTIVGSGPNGASPHHEPGDRALRSGDAVVLDFGGTSGGYCSDMTRTVVVGEEASPRLKEVHEAVMEAQERAVHAVYPGVPAEDVDRAARQSIEQAGFADRFIHRTGHGIGLETHEEPYIVQGNDHPLVPGMCFSVEPGVYLEGELGVRIEDIVVVTEDGARRLNHAPRELSVTQ